jgi:transcriptional regulator with PAS, ATPase and Fis domain
LPRGECDLTLEALETIHIREMIRRHSGNRKAAAKGLGIHPSTLFRKIKSLGIELPETDGRHRHSTRDL